MNRSRSRQNGFVLIVALGFLLVMTIAALMAVSGLLTQNALAGAAQSRALAFQSASTALAETQGTLMSLGGFPQGTQGFSITTADTTPAWALPNVWTSGNTMVYAPVNGLPAAQVVVEQLPSVAVSGQGIASNSYGGGSVRVAVFRLTAYAVGPDGHQVAHVQTTFHL